MQENSINREESKNPSNASPSAAVNEESKQVDLTFTPDTVEKEEDRVMLSMTMMEDYMDKQIDQYCTFEANVFADPNQTRDGRTIVSHDMSRMTANFSPKMNDETQEISFYGRAPSAFRMPSQVFTRPSELQKRV